MAAIDRFPIGGIVTRDAAKEEFRQAVWNWFHDHEDEVILKVGIGRLSITRRLRHLRFLIERIVGEE